MNVAMEALHTSKKGRIGVSESTVTRNDGPATCQFKG